MKSIYLIVFFSLWMGPKSWCDEFHFRDVLIGERSAGMGGAYVGIADDPSGIWHNPAGILFSFEDYFSLSAQVYTHSEQLFKNVINEQDYKYKSSGLIPNFFGVTQNYRKSKWGFALVVPAADVFDQDDSIANISSAPSTSKDLRRRFFRQNNVMMIGPAFATELFKDFSVGISLFNGYHVDKAIDNQFISYNRAVGSTQDVYLAQETVVDKLTYFVMPKIGIQWMPWPKISIGGVWSRKYQTYSKGLLRVTQMSNGKKIGEVRNADGSISAAGVDLAISESSKASKEESPNEIGLGIAYYPNKKSIFAADFYYHLSDPDYTNKVDIFNLSLGTEFFLSETFALRMGLYTNNADTPQVVETKMNQDPHVDLFGGTLSFTFVGQGSSLSFGFIMSQGSGKGQAIADALLVHEVTQYSKSLFLTGSYQL